MVKICCTTLISTLLITSVVAHADEEESYQEARRLTQAGEILPLQGIVNAIQAERQGRVLEVELERKGSQYLYEIEILDEQGVVWEYLVDAANGQILKRELED
ncbi:MAG: PepSY domain-containing protein [Candidatus Thiodiazotropha sp. 6PLUC2]